MGIFHPSSGVFSLVFNLFSLNWIIKYAPTTPPARKHKSKESARPMVGLGAIESMMMRDRTHENKADFIPTMRCMDDALVQTWLEATIAAIRYITYVMSARMPGGTWEKKFGMVLRAWFQISYFLHIYMGLIR